MTRRARIEKQIDQTLNGSRFDPAYGAQSFRSPARIAFGEALDTLLQTRPPLATLEALDAVLDAMNKRIAEILHEQLVNASESDLTDALRVELRKARGVAE